MFLSRRQFLKVSAGTVAAVALADKALALTALQPVIEVGNPLGEYPDRSWERVYHDQYRYDSSFTWVCSPNDTHACRVRSFVRNGVVMRVEQNYDHQTYEDLYGNRGTFAHTGIIGLFVGAVVVAISYTLFMVWVNEEPSAESSDNTNIETNQ